MRIDLLAAGNQYGTAAHFAKGLEKALEQHGVDTRLFWVDDGYFYQAMQVILNDPPDLTLSFADISLEGKPLGDLWQIPHLSWLVDPPAYFLHQLQGRYSAVACVDAEDHAFVQALGFQRTCFLPHAGDSQHLTPVSHPRPYQAVFFGTCVDYEAIAAAWPKHEKELLLEASRQVLSPGGISIAQALQSLGVSSADLPRLHGEVDRYTRGIDRVELIRSLQTRVHIWGDGLWQKYVPHCHIHPPIPFEETIAIMKQSQIVLNSAPRFKAGAHERLFYASLCGSAVYTGANTYLSTHLPEAYTYEFGIWNPTTFTQWQDKATACQHHVLAHHTWDQRASELLTILQKE